MLEAKVDRFEVDWKNDQFGAAEVAEPSFACCALPMQ